MQESYDEVINVLELMDLTREVSVFKGSERALSDEEATSMSEGAELIIRKALSDDPKPL
ncbi:hypothetical protein [Paenibacillus sp. DCT19]|uniref:hypothetical protein n=1 Tax=Paenibacillus sp. DCT19 TaxID=2211212 RepID=UPI0013E37B19|nr:hypothetical protein [Paenibacillus sp. DCT19]